MNGYRCGNCGEKFEAEGNPPCVTVRIENTPSYYRKSSFFCPNCARCAISVLLGLGTVHPPFIGLQ